MATDEPRPTVLLNDFTGHAFTLDLAATLADTCGVKYAYCRDNVAPHGDLAGASFAINPLGAGGSFDKYNVARRMLGEVVYGARSAWHVVRCRPQHVVVANMPILATLVTWLGCLTVRSRRVLWLQDIQSGLARASLGKQSRVARIAERLEGLALRTATQVVAISEPLGDAAIRMGANPDRVRVLPNWPALDGIEPVDRDNAWAREHGLHPARCRFVYSGTLARKHSPELLWNLAKMTPETDVIVISEGEGATWLKGRQAEDQLPNLFVLRYQPFDRLSEVLGSADVLLALLNSAAGPYSVPSKVLSYLCSARPIVAAMPAENPAAIMIVEQANAGEVTPPGDVDRFVASAQAMIANPDRARQLGAQGRAFALAEFGRDAVAQRFRRAAGID